MLKRFFLQSVVRSLHQFVKNAAIDESLCDNFLDTKPNKQFSFEKQKNNPDNSCISFCGGSTRTR